MRSVCLIHNPGAARWSAAHLNNIVRTLETHGCDVDVRETGGPGDAVTLARAAVDREVDVVAVYGGDGTMIQAVQGLIGSGIPVGLIRGGTGNLLASNLGIPRNVMLAAKVVATGPTRSIDLGRLDSESGPHYFAVAGGAGFDAELMAGTVGQSKRRWGQIAYVLQAVRSLGSIRPVQYRMTIDDTIYEVEAATVLIANCRTIMPPFLHLGERIELDDGVFDIVVLHASNALHVVAATLNLLIGRTDGVRIRRFRGQRIRIETDRTLPVQLDGELCGKTPFDVTLLAGALPVVVAP